MAVLPSWTIPAGYRTVPPTINLTVEVLDRQVAAGLGDRVALRSESRQLTYGELQRQVNAVARGLRRLGVERGDTFLIRSPSSLEYCVAFLAGLKIGGQAVMANSLLGVRELEQVVENAEARLVIVAGESAGAVRELQRSRQPFRHVVVIGSAEQGELPFEQLLEEDGSTLQAVDTGSQEPALIAYTSGTTGAPKGVVHGHRWVVTVGDLGVLRADFQPDDVVAATGELSFISALGHGFLWPLKAGAGAAIFTGRALPERMLEFMQRTGVTVLFSVPTLYRKLLAMPDLERRFDFSRLRYVNAVGEALGLATYEEWRRRTGVELYEYYGVSEFQVTTAQGPPVPNRPGSVGIPFPGVELRVLDANLRETAPGEVGLLSLRADDPGLFLGYRNMWDRWRLNFRGGWYQPGDHFRRDEDGYLWYVGRADDLFKSRGYMVSPIEVEAALLEHPAILEAAVLPQPDEHIGNAIKAIVVTRPGFTPSPELGEELRAAVRERIAPYKVPRTIEFSASLPRSPQGKLLRRNLVS